jgi:alkyl sulfatase BDS1-like metallo-beta-lactamase superfamily hydrolase
MAIAGGAFAAGGGAIVKADPSKHFDLKGQEPSKFTIEFQNGMRKGLPFEDKRDFEEAKKGFIAAPP